jgi:O-antigen biosynthesis protein
MRLDDRMKMPAAGGFCQPRPHRQYPYPDRAAVDADLAQLATLNANTILVFDAPAYVLDLAHARGLRVLYTISFDWKTVPFDQRTRDRVTSTVRELQAKPALLAWLLGNEVPSAALNGGGDTLITAELVKLYQAVKALDATHPISHSNWVTTKDLDLRFMDFSSFNVYPLWPPQVVALGYDRYIERVLRPIAGDKPLLMTEFGVNTIEAGEQEQGEILTKTWQALRRTDAAGGVVMEFADEWWKNYDNPRHARDWWDRTYAPTDELTQDDDPEESYGLVTAYRAPKPAFTMVQQMFTDQQARGSRVVPTTIVGLLTLTSVIAWLVARGPRTGRFRQMAARGRT